jgi:hypothetical protein
VTASEDAILAQILAEVRTVNAKVSGIEITVAQAVADIRHRGSQADDHEERLRALERAEVVTKDDLEASQQERARKTMTWFGLALTAFGLIETAVIAVLIRG